MGLPLIFYPFMPINKKRECLSDEKNKEIKKTQVAAKSIKKYTINKEGECYKKTGSIIKSKK